MLFQAVHPGSDRVTAQELDGRQALAACDLHLLQSDSILSCRDENPSSSAATTVPRFAAFPFRNFRSMNL